LVTNIAPAATEKTVTDFFSFCGKISRLSLRRAVAADGSHEAVVSFETESAAKTALLLTSALIIDRPIVVAPYVQSATLLTDVPLPGETITSGDNIQNKAFAVPDDQRTKTSVVASMIAAGYMLGVDSVAKAKDYDERHSISAQLKVGAEELKKKVLEVDQAYQISATAAALTAAATAQVKAVDDAYGISTTLAEKSKALDESYQISLRTAATSAAIAAGWASLTASGRDMINKSLAQPAVANATASVTQTYQGIEKESKDLIDQRMRERESASGARVSASGAPLAPAADANGHVAVGEPSAAPAVLNTSNHVDPVVAPQH